jgi:Dyp-type peroxidase family
MSLDLADIQGLLARGYRGLRHARFTVFGIPGQAVGQALLSWLLPQVTTAGRFTADSAVHVAFTAAGLGRLGLPGGVIAGFSAEFAEGMASPDRSRFLSDAGESSPRSWAWGGPLGPPVDGLVLLYAATRQALDRRHGELASRLAQAGVGHLTVLDTLELGDKEPFGFHDGISQPAIDGLPRAGQGLAPRGGRPVPAGEFVLGYPNAYGQYTDRPLLPASADPGRLLPADPEGSGAADLGRNGSYLVLRQLEQDVAAFWHYVREATRRPDGSTDPGRAVALAAKMVGRWPSGAPLVKAPDQDNPRLGDDNAFRYYHADPAGLACPLGAHIRRMNPRDSLAPDPGSDASAAVSDLHRLLRRGRGYGPGGRDGTAPADADHAIRMARGDVSPERDTGLHFICLAANLARQFEFVQHTWLNNANFHGLYDDTDPLTGSRQGGGATFTAPAHPVRRRYRGLPQFVRTRGGAYFFLPGVSALRYLEQLPAGAPAAAVSPAMTR